MKGPIDARETGANVGLGIAVKQAGARCQAELASQRRVAGELLQGIGQGLGIGGRHDETLDAVAHEVAAARHVRHDERAGGGRGLEQRTRHAFAAACRQHEDGGTAPDGGNVRCEAQPARALAIAPGGEKAGWDGFEVAVVGAAVELDGKGHAALFQETRRLHQNVDALGQDHAADEGGDGE